jgi:hypothetical protein
MEREREMKKKLFLGVSLTLLLMAITVVAYAGGHTEDQLDKAGWTCITTGPRDWRHCFPPSRGGSASTVQVKVFDVGGQSFLGTELLIHEDIYAGQPCPQEGKDQYDKVPGMPYFACHHFATP